MDREIVSSIWGGLSFVYALVVFLSGMLLAHEYVVFGLVDHVRRWMIVELASALLNTAFLCLFLHSLHATRAEELREQKERAENALRFGRSRP